MKSFTALLIVAAASTIRAATVTPGNATTTAPQVNLKNGTVIGSHISWYKQDAFLGIPFAQPPTGQLRFSLPRPIKKGWESPFKAQSYPPKCAGYGSEQIGDFEVSEDCLYLNVVRPTGYDERQLPVAVWIHGGGR